MRVLPSGLALARWIGRKSGALAVEVEGSDRVVRLALLSSGMGHYVAAVPAAMSAKAIAEGDIRESGLLLPDDYIDPAALIRELGGLGIQLYENELECRH